MCIYIIPTLKSSISSQVLQLEMHAGAERHRTQQRQCTAPSGALGWPLQRAQHALGTATAPNSLHPPCSLSLFPNITLLHHVCLLPKGNYSSAVAPIGVQSWESRIEFSWAKEGKIYTAQFISSLRLMRASITVCMCPLLSTLSWAFIIQMRTGTHKNTGIYLASTAVMGSFSCKTSSPSTAPCQPAPSLELQPRSASPLLHPSPVAKGPSAGLGLLLHTLPIAVPHPRAECAPECWGQVGSAPGCQHWAFLPQVTPKLRDFAQCLPSAVPP